jgi:hypothetical protein
MVPTVTSQDIFSAVIVLKPTPLTNVEATTPLLSIYTNQTL